jgi:hypothetical protein
MTFYLLLIIYEVLIFIYHSLLPASLFAPFLIIHDIMHLTKAPVILIITHTKNPEEEKMTDKMKENLIITGIVLAAVIIGVIMVYAELVKRAHREYKLGEMYERFDANPAEKKAYYDDLLAKQKITKEEYELMMDDNALKNAYVQYQTVIDLFQPPRSKWVKLSEERMKVVEPRYNAWVESLKAEIEKAEKKATKK